MSKMQNKIEKLCTLHQCHLSHYMSIIYMGVELVQSGEETLHPHYLLVFNRLKQVGVECRVFPDISHSCAPQVFQDALAPRRDFSRGAGGKAGGQNAYIRSCRIINPPEQGCKSGRAGPTGRFARTSACPCTRDSTPSVTFATRLPRNSSWQ